MVIIGIDPGLKGAIAIISDTTIEPIILDMPVKKFYIEYKTKSKKQINQEVDTVLLKVKLLQFGIGAYEHNVKVWIENVHSMPSQGVSSTFKFGKGYGQILGLLDGIGLEYNLVNPSEWKDKVIGHSVKWTKEEEFKLAQSYYPNQKFRGRNGAIKDGRVDAVLIARYGLLKEREKV